MQLPGKPEKVGVILVHGIGEQKRFQHLDSEVRNIIEGLTRQPATRLTVEILSNDAAAYSAEQDTWAAGRGPTTRITAISAGHTLEIEMHEVWWADINEPYSLAKQWRFWMWGLTMWTFPRAPNNPHAAALALLHLPDDPHLTRLKRAGVRLQLYLIGVFFLVAMFSIGILVFLAKRLLGLEAPDFVRVFVNYISGVKLYNQTTRQGSGFLPNTRNLLDTLDDPPRASVRRRMIRAIVAAAFRPAAENYDRWYIFAHSLGSVIAFNGVMETGQAFANYLSRNMWDELVAAGWAGPQRADDWAQVPPGPMMPKRPIWLHDDDLVYREKVFERFGGLLTYGSPLGKFAELWKARVPVNNQEPVFPLTAEWINVFDGRDPVAGPLDAFAAAELASHGITPEYCPALRNFSYRASRVLLLSHIRYFTIRKNEEVKQLADVVAAWLLSGRSFAPPAEGTGRWTSISTYWWRVVVSWLWWLVAFVFFAILGTLGVVYVLLPSLTAIWARSLPHLLNVWQWIGSWAV